MKLATWNVNSVNARLPLLLEWFRDAAPDVCALQEIKCLEEKFPFEAFESLGYNCAVHGQKTWNGVAILSKFPISDVTRGLPGDDSDEQSRYIEALIEAPQPVRFVGIYLPNGNPLGTDKYAYKLRWLERLHARAAELLPDLCVGHGEVARGFGNAEQLGADEQIGNVEQRRVDRFPHHRRRSWPEP